MDFLNLRQTFKALLMGTYLVECPHTGQKRALYSLRTRKEVKSNGDIHFGISVDCTDLGGNFIPNVKLRLSYRK